jgi:hypothetical protein
MQKQPRTPKSIPSFQQTVAAIDPLSVLVYGALERATAKTQAFFSTEKQPHDAFLAPCLMRFFSKKALRESGITAEEEGDATDFEGLPNNGLAFFYKGHHVRILKAATVKGVGWRLPGCGLSEPKTAFYNQQLEFYTDSKGNLHTTTLNIIYLWDFGNSFGLAGVHLGCPMAAGAYAKDIVSHWCEPLMHPATVRGAEVVSMASEADDGLADLLEFEDEDEAIKKA